MATVKCRCIISTDSETLAAAYQKPARKAPCKLQRKPVGAMLTAWCLPSGQIKLSDGTWYSANAFHLLTGPKAQVAAIIVSTALIDFNSQSMWVPGMVAAHSPTAAFDAAQAYADELLHRKLTWPTPA